MREIKFRLIWKDRIVGYEFHYQGEIPSGMTLISEGDHHRHGIYQAKVGDNAFADISDGLHNFICYDHKDQFVGILDDNGIEIYEGDVLKNIKGHKFIMEYGGLAFGWRGLTPYANGLVESSYDTITNPKMTIIYELEVIGNVHENKDLIDGK